MPVSPDSLTSTLVITRAARFGVLQYAVLVSELPWVEKADKHQLQTPVRAVLERGIQTGVLRNDLPIEVLNELLAGAALSAIKLTQHQQLGLEDASAAAASLFLDGARPR